MIIYEYTTAYSVKELNQLAEEGWRFAQVFGQHNLCFLMERCEARKNEARLDGVTANQLRQIDAIIRNPKAGKEAA